MRRKVESVPNSSPVIVIEKTGGYIPAGAFKVPVKNIVKALAAKGSIAPDLEARLSALQPQTPDNGTCYIIRRLLLEGQFYALAA